MPYYFVFIQIIIIIQLIKIIPLFTCLQPYSLSEAKPTDELTTMSTTQTAPPHQGRDSLAGEQQS